MGFSLIKETVATILPPSLSKSMSYLWDAGVGMGNWLGYAFSAAYYLSLEINVGDIVCEAFGYANYVIDALHVLVDFAKSANGEVYGGEA